MYGHSQYDDRLWSILGKFSRESPNYDNYNISTLDYAEFIPALVMAGATVKPSYVENSASSIDESWVTLSGYTIEIEESCLNDFYEDIEEKLHELFEK